jgi:nicotinamide mononucleotide (NMN) deamidase PncC
MERGRDPSIGSYPRLGNVTLVVTSTAPDADTARRRVDADLAAIRLRFPASALPAGLSLPAEAVAAAAVRNGATVAVAESLTAGLAASLLVDIPERRGGSAAASSRMPTPSRSANSACPRPFSRNTARRASRFARAMAEGVRARFGTTHGVATTGVAGPGPDRGIPAGSVWIGGRGRVGMRRDSVPVRRRSRTGPGPRRREGRRPAP